MITVKDIQAAVSKMLQDNGYTVFATEVKEGFKKPACFVDVLPLSVELQNANTELVTDTVEIAYFPAIETREDLINTQDNLKHIFLYNSIAIGDRFLSVNEITFDYDKPALIASFNLEYLQETGISYTPMPKMETLAESEVMESHGTSQNTD